MRDLFQHEHVPANKVGIVLQPVKSGCSTMAKTGDTLSTYHSGPVSEWTLKSSKQMRHNLIFH